MSVLKNVLLVNVKIGKCRSANVSRQKSAPQTSVRRNRDTFIQLKLRGLGQLRSLVKASLVKVRR